MAPRLSPVTIAGLLTASLGLAQPACAGPAGQGNAQTSTNPFPDPISADQDVIRVNVREFASVPDVDGEAARMMRLVAEPGTRRLFVNDMRGPIYRIGEDGRNVTLYLDINDSAWGVNVQSTGRERGFQSFAFHPQFAEPGAAGFGKFYTYTDTANQEPEPDFTTTSPTSTHDTVLLEWTAQTPGAPTYDGGPPRELIRWRQPFSNHNGGLVAFNPTAEPGAPDAGLLYVGVADGGSGGDPLGSAQSLGSAFGKLLRIEPLPPAASPASGGAAGQPSVNGRYTIPAGNPFVDRSGALPEIYAYGLRNPQRFGWDPRTGALLVADIGQNIVEEISPAAAGANLGWNAWEGSFRFISRSGVGLENPRGDATVTFPVAEWDHTDPLLGSRSAATGVVVYRSTRIPQLTNRLIFADMPSGEIFHVSADQLPDGGQSAIRRLLLTEEGPARTMLAIVQAKNQAQGRTPASRVDLRIDRGPDDQVFLLNKADGTIRVLEP